MKLIDLQTPFDYPTLTFALDAFEGPHCFGRLRPMAIVTAPASVAALLDATSRALAARARRLPAVRLCLPLG